MKIYFLSSYLYYCIWNIIGNKKNWISRIYWRRNYSY